MEAWQTKARAERDAQTRSAALKAYFMLYHHMLARQEHGGCRQVCKLAEGIARGVGRGEQAMRHPLEYMITVPVHRALFWQYLRALAVIRARHAGEALDDEDSNLLAHQADWQAAFNDVDACFWTMYKACGGGGGEGLSRRPLWRRPARCLGLGGWPAEGPGHGSLRLRSPLDANRWLKAATRRRPADAAAC